MRLGSRAFTRSVRTKRTSRHPIEGGLTSGPSPPFLIKVDETAEKILADFAFIHGLTIALQAIELKKQPCPRLPARGLLPGPANQQEPLGIANAGPPTLRKR